MKDSLDDLSFVFKNNMKNQDVPFMNVKKNLC